MKNTVLNIQTTQTILIVDDSQFSLEAMKGVLIRPGWNVITADSSNSALMWLLKTPDVSLIILHVQMQDSNGFELAKLIRENFVMQSIPILFISAVNLIDDYINYGVSVGTCDFLVKPINITVLTQRVELYLKFKQQRQFKTVNTPLVCQYKELLLSMDEALVLCDDEGVIYSANKAVQTLFGYEMNELDGIDIDQLVSENMRDRHREYQKKYLHNPKVQCTGKGRLLKAQRKDGSEFPVEFCHSLIYIDDQHLIFVLIRELNECQSYEDKISCHTMNDVLTGLPNRTVLYDRIHQGIIQAHRNRQVLAVTFISIDRFKVINNSLGPDAGDQLLILVAKRIKSTLRQMDVLVRYEGNEFVLVTLLDHTNNTKLLKKVIKANQKVFVINDHELHVSLSIGVCVVNDESSHPDELLKHANTAMNEIKARGGNNFQFFNNQLNLHAEYRLELEMGMVNALNNGEFVLHYQPRITPKNKQITGLEALVRWQHPEKGMISPTDFISVAEETHFILPLGEWVLRTASEQAITWYQSGILNGRISVNISSVQLVNKDFINTIKHQVKNKTIYPALLELELTETVMLANPDEIACLLLELKRMGFTLALDDFGTGYSSLSWLSEFPYDTIKIDQSFVSKALLTDKHKIITNSTIEMAKQLGLVVVAEGVETLEQLELLTSMGCDLVQGYYFSKPLEVEAFEELYHATK